MGQLALASQSPFKIRPAFRTEECSFLVAPARRVAPACGERHAHMAWLGHRNPPVNLLLTLSVYEKDSDVCSVLAAVMRLGPRPLNDRRHLTMHAVGNVRVFRPVYSADRISSCAILLAGAVGGVLAFV